MRRTAGAVLGMLFVAQGAVAQFTQEGSRLVGTGYIGNYVYQGFSVAISADGNTAIIGGFGDNNAVGAAWVFTRSGGVWSQQGSKLVGTGYEGTYIYEGFSVAISADGNTALIGGPKDNNNVGATWVFTRTGGVWSQQGSKLVGTGGGSRQGTSAAISADGNIAIVGGPDDEGTGGAWVFTRSGGVWSQEGTKLVGTDAATSCYGGAHQGISVAVSANGGTAIVGGAGAEDCDGAAWVFTRSGGVWSQQGSKLVGTGGRGGPYVEQGSSVAISGDGNTAIVGGPGDSLSENTVNGAMWVFTRSGGVWSQQGSKLVGTGYEGTNINEGCSVAISGDGNWAIIGGRGDNTLTGAAWVFMRSGGVWSQQGSKLVGSDYTSKGQQGTSVAISANGSTALVGGPSGPFNGQIGATWVWTRSGTGGQVPIPNFTWYPTSPQVNQSVQFTDTSTGSPTSWSWSFGDGSTSTQQNPSHAFSTSGAKTVTLTARNSSGSGSVSNSVTVTGCTSPSGAPTLTASSGSTTSVSLNWTSVPNATGYRVFRGATKVYEGTALAFTDIGLTASTQYCYTVKAYNSCGEGPASAQKCATTQSGCTAVTAAPTLTATSASATSINLSWTTVANATGYRVFRGATKIYEGTAQSYSDTGLTANTQYCYTVKAFNSCGEGPISSQSCATTSGSGPGDLDIVDFTLNHGGAVTGGSSVDCDIKLRSVGTGWPGGSIEAIVYFVDIKDVGHDSWALWRWGDDNRIDRGHFPVDKYVPALASGLEYTVTTQVKAYAADYTDAVRVVLDINGLKEYKEKPISVKFDTVEAASNCFGTVVTAAAPHLGGGSCLKSNWIDKVKDLYKGAKFGWFFGARLADIEKGNYYNAGAKAAEQALKEAVSLTAGATAECLPLAGLVTAGWNEISPWWGGSGGCGTLLAHGALALFTKGAVSATNAINSEGTGVGVRALGVAAQGTVTAFSYEGQGTLTIRDASGHATSIPNPGACNAGIPGSSCFSTSDFLFIAVPTEYGPFSLSGNAAATGKVSVRVLTPSGVSGLAALSARAAGAITEQYTWTFSAQGGDTFFTQAQTGTVSTLDVTRDGSRSSLIPELEHVDPSALLLAGPARPSTYSYLVPASAHIGGVPPTNWVTDVVLHNPGDNWASVGVAFLADGANNSSAVGPILALGPNGSLPLQDVLQSTLGLADGKGALWISSTERLLVSSRTFNNATSGTYGQYIEGIGLDRAIGPNDSARLILLTRNNFYRTNIGFANATGNPLDVKVDLFRADGSSIGTRSYTLQPWGYFQETDIIGKVTPSVIEDGFAIVRSATNGARYFTYASVVDNRTGDPINVIPAVAVTGQPILLPAAAHVSGLAGTNWRTDIEVHNPSTTKAAYTIALLKKDLPNDKPEYKNYSLDPHQSVRYVDILASMFGFSGSATLRINPTSGSLMAISRTYNDQPTGTFGQFIAGVPDNQAIAFGQTGRLVQLSQSADDVTGFRTNIGFSSVVAFPITIEVKLYRGNGTFLATKTFDVTQFGFMQINTIFKDIMGNAVEDGFAEVKTTTSGGRFIAYASVTDNRSGDPICIPARALGTAACSYTISPTSRSHSAVAETGTVAVTTSSGCAWTATSSAAWISVTSGATGSGSGTVSYSVQANSSTSSRSGTLTIAGQTFEVTQAAMTCSYAIVPMSRSHGAGYETGTVSVAAGSGCTWTATSNVAWITVTSGASSNGSGTIGYSVQANSTTSSRTGTMTIAGQAFTVTQAALSACGQSWTHVTLGTSDSLVGAAWNGSRSIVFGHNGRIESSEDSYHWTPRYTSSSLVLNDAIWTGSRFVAAGYPGMVLVSSDGKDWFEIGELKEAASIVRMAKGGSKIVAVGQSSANIQTAWTGVSTDDGWGWTSRHQPSIRGLLGIAWTGNKFVAVGFSGAIATSSDGLSWTPQNSGSWANLWQVVWTGTQLIAVGDSSTVLTSPDGVTWVANPSWGGWLAGTEPNFWGVTWTGSTVVVVGERLGMGVIALSADGVTPSFQEIGSVPPLYDVVWTGTKLIAVGDEGTILISQCPGK